MHDNTRAQTTEPAGSTGVSGAQSQSGSAVLAPPGESTPDGGGTAATSPAANGSSVGNDVLNVLADVEKQLNRIRSVQRIQDEGFATLAQRAVALQKAENEAADTARKLREQQAALKNEHARLQQQRQELEQSIRQNQEQSTEQRQALAREIARIDQERSKLQQQQAELAHRAQDVEARQTKLESSQAQIEADQQEMAAAQQRLDQARAEHDAAHKQCEARQRELASAQQRLEQAQAQLDAERKAAQIEHDRRAGELAGRRMQIETRAKELDARTAELQSLQGEIERAKGELEAERSRVAAIEAQCLHKERDLDEQQAAMKTERAELLDRVNKAEQGAAALVKQLERSQRQLEQTGVELESAREQSISLGKKAAELETAAARANQRAQKLEKESKEKLAKAQWQRDDLTRELKQADEARRLAMAELEAAHAQINAVDRKIAELQSRLTEREALLADHHQKLETAGRKLSEFASILSEHAPQLERGAAAVATVEQQQAEIERLTKQLAEYKLYADPEEMQRRDGRIADLTEALRQARGQTAAGFDVAGLEARNAELAAEIDRLRLDIQNATLAAEQARRQLDEQVAAAAGDAGQTRDAVAAEHAAKIAALNTEIDRLRTLLQTESQEYRELLTEAEQTGARAVDASRARIAELEEQVREAVMAASKASTDAAEAQARAATAEQSLQAASSGKPHGGSKNAPTPAQQVEHNRRVTDLTQKAQRVSQFAEHLGRRRARLEKVRVLLAQREANGSANRAGSWDTAELIRAEQEAESRAAQLREIERQRVELAETRKTMIETEKLMVRRWARPRALATTGWAVVIIALLAGVSWLAAGHFFPPTISASVSLAPKTRPGSPISDIDSQRWQLWHSELVRDGDFTRTLSKRMAERQIHGYANANLLASKLNSDLTIDDGQAKALTLTLAGRNARETAAMLDVVATTLEAESDRESLQRTEWAGADVLGERGEGAAVKYAMINDVPILDQRGMYASAIFGGLVVLTIALVACICAAQMRSKHLFEPELDSALV